MSDWKTFCTEFNTYQDTTASYPGSCPTNDSLKNKSLEEVSETIQAISNLKGKLDSHDSSWITTNLGTLSTSLKQQVFNFCCLYDAKLQLHTEYKQILQDYNTAKARVESIRDPATGIQDKGTTFPFGRPLRSDSVPFVLAFSFIFLIVGLGLALQIGNVKLAYAAPESYGPSIFEILREQFQQTSFLVVAIIVVVSMAVAGGIYYGISKTHPEWLGLK